MFNGFRTGYRMNLNIGSMIYQRRRRLRLLLVSRRCRGRQRSLVGIFLRDNKQDREREQKRRESGQKFMPKRAYKSALLRLGWGPGGSIFLQVG